MAKAKKPGRNRRAVEHCRKKTVVLDELRPSEAALVLERLIAAHQELRAEAEEIARSVLGAVSDSIAGEVQDAIRQLDLDDLNGRAGRHSWGYTEPTEAAWELLEEAVEPFVEDMKRHLGLGLEDEALEICQGVVLGLYELRNETGDEFLGWAPDFAAEAAGNIVADWMAGGKQGTTNRRRGRDRTSLLREFVEKHAPEWQWISEQVSRGKIR